MNYIDTLRGQLQDMGEGFVASLPSIAIAIFILFITWILARFAARISDMLVGRTDLRASLKTLIDTLVKLGIWVAGIFIAAVVVLPGLTAASLLAGLNIIKRDKNNTLSERSNAVLGSIKDSTMGLSNYIGSMLKAAAAEARELVVLQLN